MSSSGSSSDGRPRKRQRTTAQTTQPVVPSMGPRTPPGSPPSGSSSYLTSPPPMFSPIGGEVEISTSQPQPILIPLDTPPLNLAQAEHPGDIEPEEKDAGDIQPQQVQYISPFPPATFHHYLQCSNQLFQSGLTLLDLLNIYHEWDPKVCIH